MQPSFPGRDHCERDREDTRPCRHRRPSLDHSSRFHNNDDPHSPVRSRPSWTTHRSSQEMWRSDGILSSATTFPRRSSHPRNRLVATRTWARQRAPKSFLLLPLTWPIVRAVISGACAFTDAAVDNTATMTNRNDEQRVLSAEKGVVIEVPIVLICVSRSRHFSCS